MATGKGIVLNRKTIINSCGNHIKFDNKLPIGTKVWIYYDSKLNVVGIEKIFDENSIEDNPYLEETILNKEDFEKNEDGDEEWDDLGV